MTGMAHSEVEQARLDRTWLVWGLPEFPQTCPQKLVLVVSTHRPGIRPGCAGVAMTNGLHIPNVSYTALRVATAEDLLVLE